MSLTIKILKNLKILIKNPILKNQSRSFQLFFTIDTGPSDFTVTVLKTYFKRQELNIIMYRDYKKIPNELFREFVKELSEKNVQEDQFDLFEVLH